MPLTVRDVMPANVALRNQHQRDSDRDNRDRDGCGHPSPGGRLGGIREIAYPTEMTVWLTRNPSTTPFDGSAPPDDQQIRDRGQCGHHRRSLVRQSSEPPKRPVLPTLAQPNTNPKTPQRRHRRSTSPPHTFHARGFLSQTEPNHPAFTVSLPAVRSVVTHCGFAGWVAVWVLAA